MRAPTALLGAFVQRVQRSPVVWTGVVTALRTGGFIFVLPVILRSVPPPELGLWYVFLGLVQIASMLECGFAPTISRYASYFWGGAQSVPSMGLEMPAESGEPNLPALHGLIDMAKRLYTVIAIAAGVTMLLGGGAWLYWEHYEVFWTSRSVGAFVLFTVGTFVNLLGFFWTGLLFGLHRVRDQQRLLLGGMLLNYVVALTGLFLGGGIIALAAGQFILGFYPLWGARRILQREIPPLPKCEHRRVSWRELWPMTWRTGLGSYACYLSLSVITLVSATVVDLQTAASLGLSLQLALVLYGLAGSWIVVTYPRMSAIRARGEMGAVRTLVAQRSLLSFATYAAGAGFAWFLAPFATAFLRSQTQFLPPSLLGLLFVVVAVDFLVSLHAAVMVTGNSTPYLSSFVATAVLNLTLCFALGHAFGLVGIISAPLVAQLCWNAWFTPWKCWKDLRSPRANVA